MRNPFKALTETVIGMYKDATDAVNENRTDKAVLNTQLASSVGIDGVIATLSTNKKQKEEKAKEKAIRDAILSL